ncbi:MAG: hypothetical protein KGL98_11645 [Gammaproteobacteria bacterium]|nr:hypothetical protein [Gammaproteobacteria bacterium]MBU6510256.1 hypothetical protein [Gammaproteobacteria bacterium]MDE1984119.1 hypothetical protein [Gammaproteobacteria bacterium]MDE2461876.1 hypothetical protein [Gammaproteobacteria bacterium]
MGYAGIILGIIGTLVGLGGLWLSYKNYRWIKSQKIIDIRLDLIKSVISAHELVRVVQEKIRSARLSRSSLLAISGMARSGASVAMEQKIQRDQEEVNDIAKTLPLREATFTESTEEEIAEATRNVHGAHERLTTLKDNYEADLRSDEQAMNRHAQLIRRQ